MDNSEKDSTENSEKKYLLTLVVGALGVVYGDIGTSVLYAVRECFAEEHGIALIPENIFGIISLIFWSLIIVISLKYISFVMRADNKGEGGVLALMALAAHPQEPVRKGDNRKYLILLGLFGSALLYGDGVITPAISVLSAVEGLEVATPLFKPYIVGITIFILCMLFLVQSQGTAKIGKFFGPVILIWFASITILGIKGIVLNPEILKAFSPHYAVNFFLINRMHGFITLGAVCLAITGGEALYADMGHFGKRPISLGWYYVVLPSLVINYLGQGALLLSDPTAIENPFYRLAPSWGLYPLVGVATAATVIASQALISGAFSLTSQAVQLGCLPRLAIRHTSSREIGQIFVPLVNFSLLVGTILLVATFHTSSNMAAAYGIAVSTTMFITTTLTFFVAVNKWGWHPLKAGIISLIFITVDLAFFFANIIKIHHGGWVTIMIGIVIFVIMTTWRKGREILAKRIKATTFPFTRFREEIKVNPPMKVPGTAIFMTGNIDGTPPALSHNLKHNKILHQNVVLLMVRLEEVPYLGDQGRISVSEIEESLYRAIIHFGFMETPNVPAIIAQKDKYEIPFDTSNITYFLGRETVLATEAEGMAIWREKLFSFMTRNAERATTYYCIPSDQVIEIGLQVEI